MTDKQLSNIFHSFICRLSFNDMQHIKKASDATWREQNSGTASTQNTAQKEEKQVIETVIKRMLASDKETISFIIQQNKI